MIEYEPDLVLIAIGTNDIRGGTPCGMFEEDLENMANHIGARVRGCLKVILSAYMLECYSRDDRYSPWNHGDMYTVYEFNEAMKRTAEKTGSLYVDVFKTMDYTPWIFDPDIHPTNLGHAMIAFSVFNVIAANCRCLAEDSYRLAADYTVWRKDGKLVEEWNK